MRDLATIVYQNQQAVEKHKREQNRALNLKKFRVKFTLVRTGIVYVYGTDKEDAEQAVRDVDFSETKAIIKWHDESLDLNECVPVEDFG